MSENVELRLSYSGETTHIKPRYCGVRVSFSAVRKYGNKDTEAFDSSKPSDFSTFMTNYECWNAENAISPISNTDNCYFNEIVKMGMKAVPFIYEELKKGPTDLVYALDAIFNHPIKYDGFMPLKQSCDLWISILKKTGMYL